MEDSNPHEGGRIDRLKASTQGVARRVRGRFGVATAVHVTAFALGVVTIAGGAAAETPAMMLLQSDPSGGLCGFPGGSTALPAGMTLLRGGLFALGMVKIATRGGGGDGDYGTSSSRKTLALGIGVAALGILFPQVGTYLMQMFGVSPSDMGLGCAF